MKAIRCGAYGPADVLEMVETPRPEPGRGEVLVRVHATSVTTADWRLRASAFPGGFWLAGRLMFGLFRPRRKILGGDFAGVVEAVGAGAARFRPGDRVFGFSMFGAHAQFLAMPEAGAIAPIPEGLSDAEAAAMPFGALAALVFLRDIARLKPGETILILGGTGGVGCYATQLAAHMGARATAVGSAGSAALARELGAEATIDRAAEDFARSGRRYDVILDTVGATDFAACRDSLTDGGRFVPLNFGLRDVARLATDGLTRRRGDRRRMVLGVSGDTREDLARLAGLLDAGRIRPVIDRRLPLSRIVEAHRHVEGRRRRGAVVIDVPQDPAARDAA